MPLTPTQFRWTMNASRQSVDFLDLTISKHRTFESTGRVETCSYKKPNCRSQMLAFASNHPTSCKLGIFRSETNRHLLNCSNPQDLYVKIAELRATLMRRGYPSSALPIVTYDEEKRAVACWSVCVRHETGSNQHRHRLVRCHCFQMPIRYTY